MANRELGAYANAMKHPSTQESRVLLHKPWDQRHPDNLVTDVRVTLCEMRGWAGITVVERWQLRHDHTDQALVTTLVSLQCIYICLSKFQEL